MNPVFPFYKIGHFINEPDNPTEFELLRFDAMAEPEVDNFHKHTFYEILWTEKGESHQLIDYKHYMVKPNSLFFISPNQVHYFEEWQPLSGGTILFTEDFFLLNRTNKDTLFELSFLDNFYANPCIEFPENRFAEMLHLVHQIEREHGCPDRNPAIIQSYLYILLAQVQRHVDSTGAVPVSRQYLIRFKQFKALLEVHFAEKRSAAFYAGKLSITPHHLNLICREVTNQTATGIILNRSILEAKRLLTFSDKTISEIAFDLNFFDSSSFAKHFKAQTGRTPRQFKLEMSESYRTKPVSS